MFKENDGGVYVRRRDFLKTTTIAGMAATIPVAGLLAQETGNVPRVRPVGAKRKLLLMSDAPATYAQLLESIKTLQGIELDASSVQVNYQQLPELGKILQREDPDILLMCLGRVTTVSGTYAAAMGSVDIPIILLPVNFDLIMLEADLAAAFRARGTYTMVANSESHALELIKVLAAPRILEGKRAVIYGRPFDSTSVPARNLNADYVYRHTGVRIQYRPIEELKQMLEGVSPASVREEMERWKQGAANIVEPTDQAILDASRLYVLLRSIVDKEGLSAISIDCLSFSFNANPILPLPCLAFTRLRDEGISAPCEADVCASLSSMLLQEISKKPSYFCNVSSVDTQTSSTVLRHCVAPVMLMGKDAPPLTYNLRDYHGFGRGVTPEVEFPVGIDVTMGVFSKDLRNFVLWPGRTRSRATDTDRPSFPGTDNAAMKKVRRYCSNHLEVKVNDVDHFLQSIGGCHHVMVAGTYTKALQDALHGMNVNIIGPSDLSVPNA